MGRVRRKHARIAFCTAAYMNSAQEVAAGWRGLGSPDPFTGSSTVLLAGDTPLRVCAQTVPRTKSNNNVPKSLLERYLIAVGRDIAANVGPLVTRPSRDLILACDGQLGSQAPKIHRKLIWANSGENRARFALPITKPCHHSATSDLF